MIDETRPLHSKSLAARHHLAYLFAMLPIAASPSGARAGGGGYLLSCYYGGQFRNLLPPIPVRV